jgi:hypothetical protein
VKTQYEKVVQVVVQQAGQRRGDDDFRWYRWHTG